MPDGPPLPAPEAPDQPTRDIRLPPLPGRPPPAVPTGWTEYVPQPQAADPGVAPVRGPEDRPRDEPTDRLAAQGEHPRRGTLSFTPVPVPPFRVTVGPRRSRTRRLWALVLLLTVGLLAASGIWLLVHFGVF